MHLSAMQDWRKRVPPAVFYACVVRECCIHKEGGKCVRSNVNNVQYSSPRILFNPRSDTIPHGTD
jgi:hypothetical protein